MNGLFFRRYLQPPRVEDLPHQDSLKSKVESSDNVDGVLGNKALESVNEHRLENEVILNPNHFGRRSICAIRKVIEFEDDDTVESQIEENGHILFTEENIKGICLKQEFRLKT